jgi:hypothetical protein
VSDAFYPWAPEPFYLFPLIIDFLFAAPLPPIGATNPIPIPQNIYNNECLDCFLFRLFVSGTVTSPPPPQLLQITPTTLPPACGSYSTTLMATGGSGSYTWSSVSPPPGFTLDPATGVLSSTGSPPAPAGSYSFTVQVTDSAGDTATQLLTLVIPVNINIHPYVGLPVSNDGHPTSMNASIASTDTNGSIMTLAATVTACQVKGFDWQQEITSLPCNGKMPLKVLSRLGQSHLVPGNKCSNGSYLQAPPSFYDTPISIDSTKTQLDPYPFYYPLDYVVKNEKSSNGGGGYINTDGKGNCIPTNQYCPAISRTA